MKTRKLNQCGQIFSTDLLIASSAFLLILSFSIVYSNSVAQNIFLLEKSNEREQVAQTTANALLNSPGFPANWQNLPDLTSVFALGISGSRNIIDNAKLQKIAQFSQTDYEKVIDLLGAGKYGLKVLVLRLQNNQTISEFGADQLSEQSVSTVNRLALLEGEEVIVRVKVFE
ncbi:MAG: hypothetical protein HYW50_04715 [Candidatus Diapherotrites archaeon]|nr:hypothetical protein [Candidatus Diapherotrites archaeon]